MTHALVLPWPNRLLHPNARPHWAAKAKATKAARQYAQLIALEAGWHLLKLPEGRLHLWIDFYPPNRRPRDDDGLHHCMKAARDGIADAMKVNDSRFVNHYFLKDETHPGGRVEIRITGEPNP